MKKFALFFLCIAVMAFSAASGLILLIPLSPEELGQQEPVMVTAPNAEVLAVDDLQLEIVDTKTFSCKGYALAYSGGSGKNLSEFIAECLKKVQEVENSRRRLGGEGPVVPAVYEPAQQDVPPSWIEIREAE